MVKVFIKGGVWKNSEDEILKAAVMKYGKQQWARVASLLNRKSAKQCKARWNEWLDPFVKKVEWSREEEEKLLHLAKLMPAQWRTIGPLVGRTATQCQEHYEALLDEAAQATGSAAAAGAGAGAGGAAGEGGVATAASAASARQLRPGDIDSHPETKPARPDPIDMDEDEMEMLQEARARLANTQGKKAKRKARERMLNEAKRLADLQKRRELKQAGLMSSRARKRSRYRKEIDLGIEIPFHKPAPAGFHDVASELEKTDAIREARLKKVNFGQVNENRVRDREREAAAAKKREEARLQQLERSNMQYVVAQVSKKNDPISQRARGVLEMPAPAISDAELAQVAKLSSLEQATGVAPTGNAATDALLGDYSDRPLPTPVRASISSSATPSRQEAILREASNLRVLQSGETPLLGGDNGELQKAAAAKTDLGAATPMHTTASASASTSATGAATPVGLRDVNSHTPGRGIMAPRDELGLNQLKRPHSEMRSVSGEDSVAGGGFSVMSIKELAREERRAAKRARKELEEALAALPTPQFEYELAAAPDIVSETEDDDRAAASKRAKDAADVEAEEMERLREEAEKLYEARSSVVKRKELPRPVGAIAEDSVRVTFIEEDDSTASAATKLLQEEMLTMLRHDAHAHPVVVEEPGKKKKSSSAAAKVSIPPATPIDYIPEDALDAAKDILQQEANSIVEEARMQFMAQEGGDNHRFLPSDFEEVATNANVSAARNGDDSTSKPPSLASLIAEFNAISEAAAAMKKRADKLASKVSVKHGGYVKRANGLQSSVLESFARLQHVAIEETVFQMLQQHEERGSKQRVEKLKREISELEEVEIEAQRDYGALLQRKQQLSILANKKLQQQQQQRA